MDTSVWIDHLRGDPRVIALPVHLAEGEVLVHPWIMGELALGNLGSRRSATLADLAHLPAAPVLTDEEVLHMIDARDLAGTGIGWVDAQVLGSALISGARVWTHDGTLGRVLEASAIRYSPSHR